MIPFFFTRYEKAPLATAVSFLASLCFVGTLFFTVGYFLDWSGMQEEFPFTTSLLAAAVFALTGFALKKLAESMARHKQAKLAGEAAAPRQSVPSPAAPPRPAPPRAEASAHSYCTACGASLRPEAKFCTRCGARVAPPAAEEKKEAPAQADKPPLDELLGLANRYAQAEDYSRQLTVLQQAAAQYPDVPGVYNEMGIAYRLSGDYDRAIECYSKAAELDPTNGTFRTNTGVALLSSGKPEEALSWFEQGLPLVKKSNPAAYPAALGNYAMALGDAGFADNAVRCLKEAAQLGYPRAEAIREHLESLGIYYH